MGVDRKNLLGKNIYHYFIVVAILLVIAIVGGRELFPKEEVVVAGPKLRLSDVTNIMPKADKVEKMDGYYNISQSGKLIGTAIASTDYLKTNYGYGGVVPVVIAMDLDRTVVGVDIFSHFESSEYTESIYKSGFFEQWNGKPIDQTIESEVDMVSGASMTTVSVREGVRGAVAAYLDLERELKKGLFDHLSYKDILFILLLLFAIVQHFIKRVKINRTIYLLLLITIFGFLTVSMLSLQTIFGWVVSGWRWQSSWMSISLLLVAVIVPFISTPGFYCAQLCPMGALQELVSKISPVKKLSIRKFVSFAGIKLREIYLGALLTVILLDIVSDLYQFEPFMAFSYQIVGYGMLCWGAVVVIASVFIRRPWCELCPTGCVLKKLEPLKK